MRIFLATLMAATAASASAQSPPTPLKTDQAAVIGAFSPSGLRDIRAIMLAPVSITDGCLRYAEGTLVQIEDHLTADKPVFWKIHRLKPGTYALGGVYWGPPYVYGSGTTTWGGVSKQRGQVWLIDIVAGSVTDIGIWAIKSPYAQRYLIDKRDPSTGSTLAQSMAQGAGPLVTAEPRQAEIVDPKVPCPVAAAP